MTSQVTELPISQSSGAQGYADQLDLNRLPKLPSNKILIKSRFIIALLLFFVVDLFVRFQFHPDPYSLSERSFIWWAVKDYRQLKQAPDIVLFGSSLMLAVVNGGDATRYKQMVDSALHHRSDYLHELVSAKVGGDISNFSFAIGGQMASDAYAIASNFINQQFKPRLIIWGIAPRDLLDAAFPGAGSSDTAMYMNKIAGKEIVANDHRSLTTILDGYLNHISAIYHDRIDFICLLKQKLRTLQRENRIPFLTTNYAPPAGRDVMLRQLGTLRDGTMGDIEVGQWMISYTAEPTTELKDNTHEYFLRYQPFKPRTFDVQSSYLEKFLQMQKNLGVKVVLVNMPLTRLNMEFLPTSSYNKYWQKVNTLATKYGADVVDFNNNSHIGVGDFFDSAHLNGIGSKKLIELMSSCKDIHFPGAKQ